MSIERAGKQHIHSINYCTPEQKNASGIAADAYEASAKPSLAGGHALTFRAKLLEFQREKRRCPKTDAKIGAAGGAAGGAIVGLTFGMLAFGMSGVGAGAVPAGAGIGAAVGAAGGAAAGALMAKHSHHPRPDALRLHIFSLMDVVPTRADSEMIMARLKDAHVVGRGRQRPVLDCSNLDAALDSVTLHGGTKLDSQQRQQIADILNDVKSERLRRVPLLMELQATCDQLDRRLKDVAPKDPCAVRVHDWPREHWDSLDWPGMPEEAGVQQLMREIRDIRARLNAA